MRLKRNWTNSCNFCNLTVILKNAAQILGPSFNKAMKEWYKSTYLINFIANLDGLYSGAIYRLWCSKLRLVLYELIVILETFIWEMNNINLVIADEVEMEVMSAGQHNGLPETSVDIGTLNRDKAEKGMILPFEPLALTFHNVNYYVDMPSVSPLHILNF